MRDERDDEAGEGQPLPGSLWQAWPEGEPPAGFAERVAAARARAAAAPVAANEVLPQVPVRRPATWRLGALIGVAVALCIGLFVLVRGGKAPVGTAGGLAPSLARTSLTLPGEATLVAEAGAALTWRADAKGGVHVKQTAGDVFYRVAHGATFDVETPEGTVSVRGTCFRVRVGAAALAARSDDMGPKSKLAVAAMTGAAVSAAVLVFVYEGKVRLANARGQVDVSAGEAAQIVAGDAPARMEGDKPGDKPVVVAAASLPPDLRADPPADATREQLLARDAQLRAYLAGMEREHASLAKRAARAGKQPVYDLPPDEWAAMAERCEVRFDNPGFGLEAPQVGPKQAEQVGLSDDERRKVNELARTENEGYVSAMRALYVEATSDVAGSETLDVRAMEQEIQEKSSPAESSAARRKIALEKAGRLPVPADTAGQSVIERYFRLVVGVGDGFQHELTGAIGAERARAFRDELYQNRSIMNGCDE